MQNGFTGFNAEGLKFLIGLEFQNDPMFFEANRETYETYIKEPLYAMCAELAPTIHAIDPLLDARPIRAVSRIRRDARYCKDTPYRTHMWISFKPADRSNSDYFTYYFFFDANCYEIGIGFYGIVKPMMDRLRKRILDETELFCRIIRSPGIKKYQLMGQDYRRPLSNIQLPEDIWQWYNKKTFYFGEKQDIGQDFFSRDILEKTKQVFIDLMPIYDFVLGRQVRI